MNHDVFGLVLAALAAAAAVTSSGCATTKGRTGVKAATTAGDAGHKAIIVHYNGQPATSVLAAQRNVEALVTAAEEEDQVAEKLEQPLGNGQELRCLEFHSGTDARTFHRRVCGLIVDANAKAGTILVMHQLALACNEAAVQRPLATDQGCD